MNFQSRFFLGILTVVFALLMLLGCTVGITKPFGLHWDFANFYDTGRRAVAGQIADIYKPDSRIGGEQPLVEDQGFWGTPISAFIYVPLSWFHPKSALVIFKIQNTVANFAAFLVLFLFHRKFVGSSRAEQWRFAALFIFLCLIYQPFWTVYRIGGQTMPTVLLLLCLALAAHANRHFVLSSLLVVIAVMIKPAFITALILLVCVSGIRFLASTVSFLLLAGLTSVAVGGWSLHAEFLTRMLRGATVTYDWPVNSSLYTFAEYLRELGQSGSGSWLLCTAAPLTFTIKVLVVGTFIFVLLKSRAQTWSPESRNHFNFLTAMAFFLLISQTVWDHYLSVLFPLLIHVAASHNKFSRSAIALIGAIFLLSVGQNIVFIHILTHRFSFDSTPAVFFAYLFKSGPLILTLLFLWRHSRELFQSLAVPAGVPVIEQKKLQRQPEDC